MSGYTVEMRVDGVKEIRAILELAISRTNDMSLLFREKLLPYLQGIHESRFITHTGPNNEQWAPLTEAYVAGRVKSESSFPGAENILMRTGGMLGALAGENQYSIMGIGEQGMVYGISGFRDNRHIVSQFGTEGAMAMGFRDVQMGVPARPFFGLSEEQMNSVEDQLMVFIEEAFKGGKKNNP